MMIFMYAYYRLNVHSVIFSIVNHYDKIDHLYNDQIAYNYIYMSKIMKLHKKMHSTNTDICESYEIQPFA